jgi:uncharacterized membrane protein
MKQFLIKLISEDNDINEQIVAGYISLLCCIIYLSIGIFKPIDIVILKALFNFTCICFGITSAERIGIAIKNNNKEVKNDNVDKSTD